MTERYKLTEIFRESFLRESLGEQAKPHRNDGWHRFSKSKGMVIRAMKLIAIAYTVLVLILSLVAFVVYGFDKRCAQNNGRRVPEKSLHMLAILGGWPGALAGQQLFRHKTRKLSFQIVFWLTVIGNLAAVGSLIFLL